MSTKTEQYVMQNYPLAKKAGDRFGMDPLVILAQGAFESAWGTSSLSGKHNNFFGITSAAKVNEFWNGQSVQTEGPYKLKFKVYNSAQDSFNDFALLIATSYKSAKAAGTDYKLYANRIAHSQYISEKNGDDRTSYMNGIISIYENILAITKKKISLSPPPSA